MQMVARKQCADSHCQAIRRQLAAARTQMPVVRKQKAADAQYRKTKQLSYRLAAAAAAAAATTTAKPAAAAAVSSRASRPAACRLPAASVGALTFWLFGQQFQALHIAQHAGSGEVNKEQQRELELCIWRLYSHCPLVLVYLAAGSWQLAGGLELAWRGL